MQDFLESTNSITITSITNDIINNILEKAQEFPNKEIFGPDYKILIQSIQKTKSMISDNLDFFNNSEVFSEDFKKSICRIDAAFDCYLKSFQNIEDTKSNKLILDQVKNDFHLFSQHLLLFSNNISNIFDNYSENKDTKLLTQLGIESALFNFSVKVIPSETIPFYKSKFLQVYCCYDLITNLKANIAAFKSIYGSGKTLCIPLIILIRILMKDIDSNFLIMTEPTQKIVDSKTAFFKRKIGHYVTVTNNLKELNKFYKNKNDQKNIIFGILTPKDLLFLIQNNSNFFSKTRVIVDEVHEQSLHTDAVLSIIQKTSKKLQFPIHFSMMSSTIENDHNYVKFFGQKFEVTQLIDKTMFEVNTRSIKSTNLTNFIDESIKVIDEMSRVNSSIEEGNIVCFLPANDACKTFMAKITSTFNQSEETKDKRKIVILKTLLRPNETTDSYFSRLQKEYDLLKVVEEAAENEKKNLYFVPLDLSEQFENSNYELAQIKFPNKLSELNKLILTLPSIDQFATDKLSVVIDSGRSKVSKFNPKTGLTAIDLIQSPWESMNKIEGLLGRTMKGLYVSFHDEKVDQIPNELDPSIVRGDITSDFLQLKQIKIDIEKMNLPTKLNSENLDYAIQKLKSIKAINDDLKITKLGDEIAILQSFKNSVLSADYASAIINYKEKFPNNLKQSAYLFGFYLATLISMATDLIEEDMAEKLSTVFNKDSDIVTLINATKILLSTDITDNNQLRDLVESYGFKYSTFLVFKSILNEANNFIFNDNDDVSVSKRIDSFIQVYNCDKKGNKIIFMVDGFIEVISSLDLNWKKMHSIEYVYVKNPVGFPTRPTLIFAGNPVLSEWNNQKKKNLSEVRVTKRPGWHGSAISMNCYFFNICIYLHHYGLIYGNIFHRSVDRMEGELVSMELPKYANSQWFIALVCTYFSTEKLNVRTFKVSSSDKKGNLFYFSTAGERVYLTYIPLDDKTKSKIEFGVKQCLKLMPFVPRSVLIFRNGPKSLFEVTSIGTENYICNVSLNLYGDRLNRKYIDYCLHHLDEMAKSSPKFRICCLFFNKECTIDDLNQRRLYFVCSDSIKDKFENLPNIEPIIEKSRVSRKELQEQKEKQKALFVDKNNKNVILTFYSFPPNFIHPALMFHQETLSAIKAWFNNCKYASYKAVLGQRFLMPINDIKELEKHLQKEKDKIKQEMNLKYTTVPIPSKVYEKAYLTIREHQSWTYDSKFKVVIATINESNEVRELVKKINEELEATISTSTTPTNQDEQLTETLGCCYICDDPDNPTLTNDSITLYYKDGKTITTKMCRDCLVLNLQNATSSFYSNGKINQENLESISKKPAVIPSIGSKDNENGDECWPQIPLGQLILMLFNNNDDELSDLVSAWLNSIQEFAIRNLAISKYTFCPKHPRMIFRVKDMLESPVIKCKDQKCKDVYCYYCNSWHLPDFVCEEKKNGKALDKNTKCCPRCKAKTSKDGGCNHITCPKCGCHWCYVCGKGYNTDKECYAHMKSIHGNSYADLF